MNYLTRVFKYIANQTRMEKRLQAESFENNYCGMRFFPRVETDSASYLSAVVRVDSNKFGDPPERLKWQNV